MPRKAKDAPRATTAVIRALTGRRARAEQIASRTGAGGERSLARISGWVRRPTGKSMKNLMQVFEELGFDIKKTSFDAIDLGGRDVDFGDPEAIRDAFPTLTFVEIKTAN